MSCCCNSSPCTCVPACLEDCPEVIEYEASNINLAGIGVYDSQSGNEFQFRGIRSTDGAITVALNNTFHTIDLTVPDLEAVGTKVFTNAANRALTVPAFEGQLGVQTDTDVIYYSTGTSAGNWATDFTFLSGKTTTMATGTIVQVGNAATATVISPTNNSIWDWENLQINYDNCDQYVEDDSTLNVDGELKVGGTLNIGAGGGAGLVTSDNSVTWDIRGSVTFQDGQVDFSDGLSTLNGLSVTSGTLTLVNGTILAFGATAKLSVGGTQFPVNNVLISDSVTAGIPAFKALNTFISTANTQTGWGTPTGTLSRLTFDESTVTLPELAQRVAALITDLKLVKLPAT